MKAPMKLRMLRKRGPNPVQCNGTDVLPIAATENGVPGGTQYIHGLSLRFLPRETAEAYGRRELVSAGRNQDVHYVNAWPELSWKSD